MYRLNIAGVHLVYVNPKDGTVEVDPALAVRLPTLRISFSQCLSSCIKKIGNIPLSEIHIFEKYRINCPESRQFGASVPSTR